MMPTRFVLKALAAARQQGFTLMLAALALPGSVVVASAESQPPVAVVGSFIDPAHSDAALFSADGKIVALPDLGLLWDATSGLPLRRMIDPVFVTAGAFTPDGATFVSGHTDGAIKSWNVATGEVSATLAKPADDRVASLWLDANGASLVSGDAAGLVNVRRLPTGQSALAVQVRSTPDIVAKIIAAKLSADAGRLIVLAHLGYVPPGATRSELRAAVMEYDASSGAERSTFVLPAKHMFLERGLVGDGDALILVTTACERGEVKLWSLHERAAVADVHKPATCDKPTDSNETEPARIFSSPQSSRVLIVPNDAPELLLWDVAARKLEKTVRWPEQTAAANVIGLSHDLGAVAVVERGAVRIRALDTGAPIKEFRGFGPGARNVVARGRAPQILLQRQTRKGDTPVVDLDLRTGALQPVTLHLSPGSDVKVHDFAPEPKLAIAGNDKGDLLLLSLEAGKPARRLEVAGLRELWGASLSPDGKMALLVAEFGKQDPDLADPIGVVIDTADGRIRHTFEVRADNDHITATGFAADGATFAVGHRNGMAEIWDARSLKRIKELRPAEDDADVIALSFSPDGRFLIGSGMFEDSVYVWNVATGKAVRVLDLGESFAGYRYATAVAMSRDGKTIAAGLGQRHISSGDFGRDSGKVVVWDAATGNLRFTLQSQRGEIRALAFSADDRLIVSGSLDGTVQYWDRGNGRLMATAMSSTTDDWLVLSESGIYAGSDGSDAALAIVRGSEAVAATGVRQRLRQPALIEDLLKGDGGRYRDAARKLDLPAVLKSKAP
jgi:WD40 repeat protein